jgi:hypothetical protein
MSLAARLGPVELHQHAIIDFCAERFLYRAQVSLVPVRGIGQPREAAHAHPHSQVVPLDMRRADVLRVGLAERSTGRTIPQRAVEHEVERQSVTMVLNLLAERVINYP